MVDFKKVKEKEKLVDIAYREIKQAIMLYTFKPGECLSTNQLAATLNMSRTPIREALNMLAIEGLVEIQNGVGIYVKGFTIKEIMDLYDVRVALETIALKSAIDKISGASVDALITKWENYKTQFLKDQFIDLHLISKLDYETHFELIEYTDNMYLKNLMKEIYNQVRRIQFMSAKALGNAQETIDQHIELLEYIKQKDLQKACDSLELHIRNAIYYITNNPSNISL